MDDIQYIIKQWNTKSQSTENVCENESGGDECSVWYLPTVMLIKMMFCQ